MTTTALIQDPAGLARANTLDGERNLRATLRVDSAITVATGLALAAAAGPIDRLLDTGHPGWLRAVGAVTAFVGVEVGMVATATRRRLLRLAPYVIAAGIVWVVASVVTTAAGWYSSGGAVAVLAVAAAVDVITMLHWRSWRRARGVHGDAPRSAA